MVNACTVTVRRRLPYTHMLADSFLANRPGGHFTAPVLDQPLQKRWPDGTESWSSSELGISANRGLTSGLGFHRAQEASFPPGA
jgi:hypothetical protein